MLAPIYSALGGVRLLAMDPIHCKHELAKGPHSGREDTAKMQNHPAKQDDADLPAGGVRFQSGRPPLRPHLHYYSGRRTRLDSKFISPVLAQEPRSSFQFP